MNRKYPVYKNDLKFRKMRNINPNFAEWDDDVKEAFNKDFDNIKSRLNECKENNFLYLDLSRLDLEHLPDLSQYKYYSNLKLVKYLFLGDNQLKTCDNKILYFENLEVLDISYNKLKKLQFLPITLKELICNDNELNILENHDNIKILDCSNNKICTLGKFNNLLELNCHNNNLIKIISYNNLKKLICKNNPLTEIEQQLKLEFCDCSETKLHDKIEFMPNLIGLICNSTNIHDISELQKLESLEITNCNMKIPYIKTLKCLICNDNALNYISKYYKVKDSFIQENSVCLIFST